MTGKAGDTLSAVSGTGGPIKKFIPQAIPNAMGKVPRLPVWCRL